MKPKWWMILLVVILVLGAVASMFVRFLPHDMRFVPANYAGDYEVGDGASIPYWRGGHRSMMYRAAPFAMGGFMVFGLFRTLLFIGVIGLFIRLLFGRRWDHIAPHGYRGKYPHHPHGWYCGPYPGYPHTEGECEGHACGEHAAQPEDGDTVA